MWCKLVVLALWLLNQTLSLALPALFGAAEQGSAFPTAPQFNKPTSISYLSVTRSTTG